MADDMNTIPQRYYKAQMQAAKDAAMADGVMTDQEREALMDPKARLRLQLQKTAAQITAEQKYQHAYSDIFNRKPPPGLFYAEAVLQPATEHREYIPHPGAPPSRHFT